MSAPSTPVAKIWRKLRSASTRGPRVTPLSSAPAKAGLETASGATQNAASGTSIRALSVASAMARWALICGSICRAKKDAAATLPV